MRVGNYCTRSALAQTRVACSEGGRSIVWESVDNNDALAPQPVWPMSLLWPPGESNRASVPLSNPAVEDLALERIVQALDVTGRHAGAIRTILCQLCLEPAVIQYRQEVLADLLALPELVAELQALMPELAALLAPGSTWPGESPLMPAVARLAELDRYVACLDQLKVVLDNAASIRSRGLRELQAAITTLAADRDIVALRAELPALRDLISEASSVTIGLNLGRDLQPESATIVEVNPFPFRGARTLLGRLLPGSAGAGPTGVGPLHHVGPVALRRDSQLYKDLQRLLESVAQPLIRALARYRELNAGSLGALEREFAWYTGAALLIGRMQARGIEFCCPEIVPTGAPVLEVTGAVNLALALQLHGPQPAGHLADHIVANDIGFDQSARLLIVTGPNRGGKTTYCRAVGQAQVLFQSGLYIPGSAARLSPCDGVWTHFPLPETDRPGAGRLDEEVRRLRQLFSETTTASLILLNEPLTSTSERDALPIATGIVRALQMLGARTVLVTHLHELALAIPDLNEQGPDGCQIRSMIALATSDEQGMHGTFRIVPGLPTGRSYADEIARQHGLTFEQLQGLLGERGVLGAEVHSDAEETI